MTRVFGQTVTCPQCGTVHTAETQFSRDVRNEPILQSNLGYAAADVDCDSQKLVWHKYKDGGSRAIQFMMDIEVKTRGSDMTESEKDTLIMRNQIIRNRRATPTKKRRFESGFSLLKVYSNFLHRDVYLRHLGVHLIRFSNTSWSDSEWIEWDRRRITKDQLISILRFSIDPDTLLPMETRSHHKKTKQQELELVESRV